MHKNKPAKNFGSFDSFKFDGCERKNNAVNHQKTAYGKGFGVPEVIRTPDLSLRRRSLYPAELRKRMQQLFNFEPSQDSNDLPLRRRVLYPAELLRHLKVLCNFQGSKESNNLPLRRRSLYPAELRKQMAAEPPVRLLCKFCLALREKTLAVHDKALVRALSDKTGFIRCFNPEGQTATIDFGQRSRTGDVHADRGR